MFYDPRIQINSMSINALREQKTFSQKRECFRKKTVAAIMSLFHVPSPSPSFISRNIFLFHVLAMCPRFMSRNMPWCVPTLKCLYGQQGFCSFGISVTCKKVFQEKKTRLRHFNALKSGFKVPASAMPSKADHESVQKRVWVFEWVMTSSQELPNLDC